MKDINTVLQTVVYDYLGQTGDEYWEDEEGDDRNDDLYGVIGPITVTDDSAMTCTKVQATFQIALHSKKAKYNNRVALNLMADRLFAALKPASNSILDLEFYNMQMTNLRLIQDTQQDSGKLGAYDYKTRILIFQCGIFIR